MDEEIDPRFTAGIPSCGTQLYRRVDTRDRSRIVVVFETALSGRESSSGRGGGRSGRSEN